MIVVLALLNVNINMFIYLHWESKSIFSHCMTLLLISIYLHNASFLKSFRFRKCGTTSVCFCVATWWADCLAAVRSTQNPDLCPLCPYLSVSTVCDNCSFFIPNPRR